jgi:hypothetical protein
MAYFRDYATQAASWVFLSPTQVCVRWKPPEGKYKHLITKYKVRWGESARQYKEMETEYASCILRDLNVNTEYVVQVNPVIKKGKFDIHVEVKEPSRTAVRTSTRKYLCYK